MKFMSEQEIMDHYHMTHAIKDVKETLMSLVAGKIKTEERIVIESDDNTMLYMPCVDLKENFSLIKIISIFPGNPDKGLSTSQAVSILSELKTGKHVATLDASYLTRLRTGAITGIATDSLARQDAEVVGVIGTGGMAFEQLLGVLAVRTVKKIVLYNRTMEKAQLFAEQLRSAAVDADIEVVSEVNQLTAQADIINCATKSHEAVFDHRAVKQGTHINGLGSYLPSMREINVDTIAAADLIVLDDWEGAKYEAGEFIEAEALGRFNWNEALSLTDLISQQVSRQHINDITIFKSVGASYYDLAVGVGAYKLMQ